MKKTRIFYLITLISTSIFVILQLFDPAIIREQLEGKAFDLRLYLRNMIREQPIRDDIVIVAVDEKSIREIGRWPWRRDVMAWLISKISEDRPKAIGVDIILSEEESRERDEKLAEAIEDAGNVVLAMAFIVPEMGKKDAAPEDIRDFLLRQAQDFLWDSAFREVKGVKGIPWKKWAVKAEDVIPPLEEFSKVSSLGHVYGHQDMDGVLRWEVLYLNYGDDCYPSFPLQVARVVLGIEMKDMILYGGSGVSLGDRFIPADISGRALINYRGREGSFKYVSASDVIKGKATGLFRGRIVLIGTSALGAYDQKVTPLSANMPGVEKNANAVENILSNDFLRKSPGVVELAAILLTGLSFGLLLPRLRAIPSAVTASAFVVSYTLLGLYLLIYGNLWINLLYPISNMFAIFTAETITRFFLEEKKAREIRRMFSSYVSPKIVEELMSRPEKARLGGERRVVTVLFFDIIGFTGLSERLPPEEVVNMLNEYFGRMVDIIFKWDGTLDKFIGDALMAFWGAPLDQPNHAELAVRCALDISDRLDEMHKVWRGKGREILDCGIGINTGEVLIGNIGAEGKKMDYTAIGDHVNLAARVEKLTRQYGVRILTTENTIKEIEALIKSGHIGHVEIGDLADVKVKGKERGIKIFGIKTKKPKKS